MPLEGKRRPFRKPYRKGKGYKSRISENSWDGTWQREEGQCGPGSEETFNTRLGLCSLESPRATQEKQHLYPGIDEG